jgi:adenylosuccinate lyase
MNPITLPDSASDPNFNAIDPLDGRYYDHEIAKYLSERSRIAYQFQVEAALALTLADFNICSHEVAEQIVEAGAKVTAEAVRAEEKTTKHDIKALVNVIKNNVDEQAKPYVHFGATSYDIVATALSLQLRDATNNVVLPRLVELEKTLLTLTDKYAETVQIGRTHGQHAVPITFGFAIAEYVSRLGENIQALKELSSILKGKFSGAVGAYNALSIFIEDPFKFESALLAKLDIQPADYSTQIIPAEGYVRLIDEMAISAGIMANLGHDMRHLQRTEIAEVREAFEAGQTGSSTMAHKRNPWNFENVISMSKQVTAQLVNANLNLPSEHQRDLTDSASARFYGLVLASVASMAKRLNSVMQKLEVDEDNMAKNLKMSGGAIAAEPLYLLLEKYGHTTGHEVSKSLAHQSLESNRSLYEVASSDASIEAYFSKFSDNERLIIQEPEKYYTGLAAKKARLISDRWQIIEHNT